MTSISIVPILDIEVSIMQTYIINSTDDFHQYYPLLKNSARIGSTPDVYLVGFDTESFCKDNFPKSFELVQKWLPCGKHYNTVVCTIQLASDTVCLVVNLIKLKGNLPNNLLSIIKNDSWIKVGVGIELDLLHLSNNYQLGHCSGSIEIRNLALLAKYPKPNLEYMFNQLVGGHIKKTVSSVCDWSVETLTHDQLIYASRDAIMSLQLFKHIIKPSIDNLVRIDDNNRKKVDNMLKINFVNLDDTNQLPILSEQNDTTNYVGKLNEIAQKEHIGLPIYQHATIMDPITHQKKHDKFEVVCIFKDKLVKGYGYSKKEAKTDSAKQMFFIL